MLIRDIIPPQIRARKRIFSKILSILVVIFLITQFFVGMKGSAAEFVATKRTDNPTFKRYPQFQAVGTKIYYVWTGNEESGFYQQIWTAEMNINGSGWSVTKRTDNNRDKYSPQLQVVGSKIYYAWEGEDGNVCGGWPFPMTTHQIFTGEMNIDGTGWTANQMTTSTECKGQVQFQVSGSKIYYVFEEKSGSYWQIWTAEMNTDGTGWAATQRTTSTYQKYNPQLQVVDSKIYYAWSECDGTSANCSGGESYQIWTGEMNTDGSGWQATQRTISSYDKDGIQLQVVGDKIYYVWSELDGAGYTQIWAAEMNTDGTGWVAAQMTTGNYFKYYSQLQVMGEKIYYVWEEDDGTYDQIWTAEMNIGGSNWSATKRTTSAYYKDEPQLQMGGSRIYYLWQEDDDSSYSQIWTGEMGLDLLGIGGFRSSPVSQIPPQPLIPGKTIEEMKIDDILRQMYNVLTQLNQLHSKWIEILKVQ